MGKGYLIAIYRNAINHKLYEQTCLYNNQVNIIYFMKQEGYKLRVKARKIATN